MDFITLENRVSARNYAPLPVVLTRGEGSYLWDADGKRYVDMMSAYSAVSLGHAHPRILAALTAQAQRLAVPSRAYYTDRLGPFLEELFESFLQVVQPFCHNRPIFSRSYRTAERITRSFEGGFDRYDGSVTFEVCHFRTRLKGTPAGDSCTDGRINRCSECQRLFPE